MECIRFMLLPQSPWCSPFWLTAFTMMLFVTGCQFRKGLHRITSNDTRDAKLAFSQNQLGLKHLRNGKLDKAESAFLNAISADSELGAAHNNLGKVYLLQRKHYLAAGAFDTAARLMTNRFEPHLNLGLVYENVEKYAEAEMHYSNAYAMVPHEPLVIAHFARVRVKQELFDEQTKQLLESLVFHDNHGQWIAWAREQLGLRRFAGMYEAEALGEGGDARPFDSKDLRLIPSGDPQVPPRVEVLPAPSQKSTSSDATPFLLPVQPNEMSQSMRQTPPWMPNRDGGGIPAVHEPVAPSQGVVPATYQQQVAPPLIPSPRVPGGGP